MRDSGAGGSGIRGSGQRDSGYDGGNAVVSVVLFVPGAVQSGDEGGVEWRWIRRNSSDKRIDNGQSVGDSGYGHDSECQYCENRSDCAGSVGLLYESDECQCNSGERYIDADDCDADEADAGGAIFDFGEPDSTSTIAIWMELLLRVAVQRDGLQQCQYSDVHGAMGGAAWGR